MGESWLARLVEYGQRYRRDALVALGSAAAAGLAGVVAPLIVREVIDDVVIARTDPMTPWLLALAGLGLLRFAVGTVRHYYAHRLGNGIGYALRTDLFDALQRLDGRLHDRLRTGQVVSRSISDVAEVEQSVVATPPLLADLVLAGLALAVMTVLSPMLTLVALVILPALYLVARVGFRKLLPASWDYSHQSGEVAGVVESVVAGVRVVKGFGQEQREQERLEAEASRLFASGLRRTRLEAAYFPVVDKVPALGQVGVLALGGWLALRGDITVGTLVAFASYLASMIGRIEGFVDQLANWQMARAAFGRVLEVVDARPDVVERPAAREAPTGAVAVELDDVTFAYDEVPVLRSVTLRIEPGETLALVGGTGSGKSTVAALLARFYDPQAGVVCLGGHDVRDLTLGSLRGRIGMVFEEPTLFSDTVRANIALAGRGTGPGGRLRHPAKTGTPDAGLAAIRMWRLGRGEDDDVVAAARAAEADAFIRALPDGYDTVIGERGLTLSGGERQRVALARALLTDPQVLVLDDAMSAVDAGVEAAILTTLRRVLAGRTTLLVAHRRSTLRLADRIAVLQDGEVVAVGTHDDLLGRCAHYRHLVAGPDEVAEPSGAAEVAVLPTGALWSDPPPETSAGVFGAERLRADQAWLRLRPATESPDVDVLDARTPEPDFSLRRLVRPFRAPLAGLVVLMGLGALTQLAIPWLIRTGIDRGVRTGDAGVLALMATLGLGVVAVAFVVQRYDELNFGRLGERMLFWLRVKLSAHLHRLGLDFYERERGGHVMTRMTADVQAVTTFVQAEVGRIVVAGLTFVGVLSVMLTLSVPVTLALLVLVPAFAGAVVAYRRSAPAAYEVARECLSTANAYVQERVAGIRVAQAYGCLDHDSAVFRGLAERYRAARLRAQRYAALFVSFAELTNEVAVVIVLGVGTTQVVSGDLTVGGVVAFTLYVALLFSPLQQLSRVFDGYQRARVGLRQLREFLRTPTATPEAPDPLPVSTLTGEIACDDVRFGYRPGDVEALRGINLRIEPDETVAVVGETGAGKSTLLKLFARFYDPTAGTVSVDATDLRKLDLHAYRRRLGVVPQEPHLFEGNVRDTIRYGRPGATDAEVERAARAVGAHDMIAGLPHGYLQPVGDRGRGFSAGQRQLLALARAQLVQPDLLLLDEATAALDLATEAAVVRAGARLTEPRTSVVIAHRLSTARRADRIIVVDHGRIVETGTHEELVAAGGQYAELWHAFTEC